METGRLRPESPGLFNSQTGTNGIGKYRCKHCLLKSQRG